MKTDALFYELFKIDPQSLFRLVHLSVVGEYAFESLAVKTTEKRMDGFLKRIDQPGPHVFLEIQGYKDEKIYWRLFREIFSYYEQTETNVPFIAIVLFLEPLYDPGACPVACVPPHQLIRANLLECLKTIEDRASVLTVLKPLALHQQAELYDVVEQWKDELESLPMSPRTVETLLELLEYVILQRFPKMSSKELRAMLRLIPLEETVAGQELIQEGKQLGLREGKQLGLQEGNLSLLSRQIIKHFGITPEHVMNVLHGLHGEDFLELGEYVLECETFVQIEEWVRQRKTRKAEQADLN